MYFMYVDESGDPGLNNSPTRYFILTGLVVHELRWQECLDLIIDFRKRMRDAFGLRLREEIHAAHMINNPGHLVSIKRNDRLSILRFFLHEISGFPDVSIINVVIDKQGKPADYDVMENAWAALIQRFSNTITHRNFPGPANADERGFIVPDNTDAQRLTALLRKMRKYNPVPSRYGSGYRNIQIKNIVEDPFFKDSRASYFIQAADVAAYALYQQLTPSSFMRSKGAQHYFQRLSGVLCRHASPRDPDGIVRL